MGQSVSKGPKINKNHNRQKMFRMGASVGQNDVQLKGHLHVGCFSKTIKNYNDSVPLIKGENNAIKQINDE